MARSRSRARNLDEQAIEQIVAILDGWSSSKLTWELLIEQITLRLRSHYTRQALHNHVRIKDAFSARKKSLAGSWVEQALYDSPELQHAMQRIARLEAENERLSRENNNLLEQINRWIYNAYVKQMDHKLRSIFNEPLPAVQREPSLKQTPKG